MTPIDDRSFDKFFCSNNVIELLPILTSVQWINSEQQGRLWLPPIQRSFVWDNERILNYWDSLIRGFPPGIMLVRRAKTRDTRVAGVNAEGTTDIDSDKSADFLLFDGQQRLLSLLLGFGSGSRSKHFELWLDVGKDKGSGGRLLDFRINSSGQPYGYKADWPNEKIDATSRRDVLRELGYKPEDDQIPHPRYVFENMREAAGSLETFDTQRVKLSKAKFPLPLRLILKLLCEIGLEETSIRISKLVGKPGDAHICEILRRFDNAKNIRIPFQLISNDVTEEHGYQLLFTRIGQGGVRLTDDELTYSLIKDRYPIVRDRIREIVEGDGKFASEVNLVLGALRVARTLRPWDNAKTWEKAARPRPEHVNALSEKGRERTEAYFKAMLPDGAEEPRLLKAAIHVLRNKLEYHHKLNPSGLPLILLARLPHELIDVLLLISLKTEQACRLDANDRDILIPFVLHWLLFVGDDSKAADEAFLTIGEDTWHLSRNGIASLIKRFEFNDIARYAPRPSDWCVLTHQVAHRQAELAGWSARFTGAASAHCKDGGAALRVLSTHPEIIKRILMWIQRRYLTSAFPDFEPMSLLDVDMPFDFDHLIPSSFFGFHWSDKIAAQKLDLPAEVVALFKMDRGTVGNSLGNMRWLSVVDNRRRKDGPIESITDSAGAITCLDDHVDIDRWNMLIKKKKWGIEEVALFQQLIDTRSLKLTKLLMDVSGVDLLVATADNME